MSTSVASSSEDNTTVELENTTNLWAIVGKGIVMGLLHVFTGVDHLSALATLSSNLGVRQAFQIGIRWGIGHSIGLVLVATILLLLSSGGEIKMSHQAVLILQSLVGIFMIVLGTFGIFNASRRDKLRNDELNLNAQRSTDLLSSSIGTSFNTRGHLKSAISTSFDENDIMDDDNSYFIRQGEASLSLADIRAIHTHPTAATRSISNETEVFQIEDNDFDEKDNTVENMKEHTKITADVLQSPIDPQQQGDHKRKRSRVIACLMGILQGVAGPGGVLGILPAVQLHNYAFAYTYLASFCITSMVGMGSFASLYGICTSKISQGNLRIEFHLDCFSAAVSIIVGVLWLCLLYTGNLHMVFR